MLEKKEERKLTLELITPVSYTHLRILRGLAQGMGGVPHGERGLGRVVERNCRA